MRIGVFGGSFNPVHNGHLRLAVHAKKILKLDQVIFVPTHQTPLKDNKNLLPDALRIKFLKNALKKYPDFYSCLCEIKRGGFSYTVDTLEFFKRKYGKRTELFFLMGADALGSFLKWKSFAKILTLCQLVVLSRPGHVIRKAGFPFIVLPFEAMDVSSSQIRLRLKKKVGVGGLVPASAEAELKKYFEDRGKLKRNQGGVKSKPKKK